MNDTVKENTQESNNSDSNSKEEIQSTVVNNNLQPQEQNLEINTTGNNLPVENTEIQPNSIEPSANIEPTPSASSDNNSANPPKSSFTGLILMAIIVVLIILGYFFIKGGLTEKITGYLPFFQKKEELVTPVGSATLTPTNMEITSSLMEIDDVWITYKNDTLGFSINIPKLIFHNYGACLTDKDGFYRPKGDFVPVEVFEDNRNVFISTKYFYRLGEMEEKQSVSTYSKCDKVENSLEQLTSNEAYEQQKWKFTTAVVENDEQLSDYIKNNYGLGCKLKSKTESTQYGVFDVKIDAGSYENIEEAQDADCLVNYVYNIKYSPEKKLAVGWIVGQSYSFYKNDSFEAYDEEMLTSFKIN